MGILRKIKKMVISRNPQDYSVDNLQSNDEIHNLSDVDGSLESIYVEEQNNQACGCFGTPGGRCSECGAISCVRCHRHCGGTDIPNPLGCGKPLCREHSHYLVPQNGQSIPFCRHCYGKITRRERWELVGRLLFEPFVEKEEKS